MEKRPYFFYVAERSLNSTHQRVLMSRGSGEWVFQYTKKTKSNKKNMISRLNDNQYNCNTKRCWSMLMLRWIMYIVITENLLGLKNKCWQMISVFSHVTYCLTIHIAGITDEVLENHRIGQHDYSVESSAKLGNQHNVGRGGKWTSGSHIILFVWRNVIFT